MLRRLMMAGQSGAPLTPYYDAVMVDTPALYLRFAEPVSGGPNNSGSASISSPSYNLSSRGQASLSGDAGDYSVAVTAGSGTRGPLIQHSSSSTLLKPNDFTIEAIIYPTTVAGQRPISSTNTNNTAELRIINGQLTLIRRNTAVVGSSTTNITANVRSHVACRVALDGTYTFFLNGSAIGTGAGYSAFLSATTTYIGFETASSNVYEGRIDEWAYYTSALSDARIAAHAAAMT